MTADEKKQIDAMMADIQKRMDEAANPPRNFKRFISMPQLPAYDYSKE